jgi:hypothetical protein
MSFDEPEFLHNLLQEKAKRFGIKKGENIRIIFKGMQKNQFLEIVDNIKSNQLILDGLKISFRTPPLEILQKEYDVIENIYTKDQRMHLVYNYSADSFSIMKALQDYSVNQIGIPDWHDLISILETDLRSSIILRIELPLDCKIQTMRYYQNGRVKIKIEGDLFLIAESVVRLTKRDLKSTITFNQEYSLSTQGNRHELDIELQVQPDEILFCNIFHPKYGILDRDEISFDSDLQDTFSRLNLSPREINEQLSDHISSHSQSNIIRNVDSLKEDIREINAVRVSPFKYLIWKQTVIHKIIRMYGEGYENDKLQHIFKKEIFKKNTTASHQIPLNLETILNQTEHFLLSLFNDNTRNNEIN